MIKKCYQGIIKLADTIRVLGYFEDINLAIAKISIELEDYGVGTSGKVLDLASFAG